MPPATTRAAEMQQQHAPEPAMRAVSVGKAVAASTSAQAILFRRNVHVGLGALVCRPAASAEGIVGRGALLLCRGCGRCGIGGLFWLRWLPLILWLILEARLDIGSSCLVLFDADERIVEVVWSVSHIVAIYRGMSPELEGRISMVHAPCWQSQRSPRSVTLEGGTD